eukprot:TRINITY_DN24323_c0_g1_i1.p1 TRINITY_DN24323_c0_g1~~TRINITY_DN24323_c0_g1_i1.p1  ORF type:complete len:412 (+),score=87.78 TRINITY_DN24323_c0_g1_i1:186-1238(+)
MTTAPPSGSAPGAGAAGALNVHALPFVPPQHQPQQPQQLVVCSGCGAKIPPSQLVGHQCQCNRIHSASCPNTAVHQLAAARRQQPLAPDGAAGAARDSQPTSGYSLFIAQELEYANMMSQNDPFHQRTASGEARNRVVKESLLQRMQHATARWESMSDAEKARFNSAAEQNKRGGERHRDPGAGAAAAPPGPSRGEDGTAPAAAAAPAGPESSPERVKRVCFPPPADAALHCDDCGCPRLCEVSSAAEDDEGRSVPSGQCSPSYAHARAGKASPSPSSGMVSPSYACHRAGRVRGLSPGSPASPSCGCPKVNPDALRMLMAAGAWGEDDSSRASPTLISTASSPPRHPAS